MIFMRSQIYPQLDEYMDLLLKDEIENLISSDHEKFICTITQVGTNPHKYEKLHISLYPKIVILVGDIVSKILSDILEVYKENEAVLIPLLKVLRKTIPALSPLSISKREFRNSINKLYQSTQSVDIFTNAVKLFIYLNERIRNTEEIRRVTDFLKVGRQIDEKGDSSSTKYQENQKIPKIFLKNLTQIESLKIKAFSFVELRRIDPSYEINSTTSYLVKFISYLHSENSLWMLSLLSQVKHELTKDIFMSILESTINLETMKYTGVEQYFSPAMMGEQVMVLAAKYVSDNSQLFQFYLKDAFLEYNNLKILKYPIKIYRALAFCMKKQRKRDWVLEERNMLINNLLETLKTYQNFFFNHFLVAKIAGVGNLYIEKLDDTEHLQFLSSLLEILFDISGLVPLFNYFERIYMNKIIPQSIKILNHFLEKRSNKSNYFCWNLLGKIACILSMHVSEGVNLKQILRTSIFNDLTVIILNYQFPNSYQFAIALEAIYENGYNILLEKTENIDKIRDKLFLKLVKYYFKYPFLSEEEESNRYIDRERQLGNRNNFLKKLTSYASESQYICSQVIELYKEVINLTIEQYLSNRYVFESVIITCATSFKLKSYSSKKKWLLALIDDNISELLTKFPILLAFNNFQFEGEKKIIREKDNYSYNQIKYEYLNQIDQNPQIILSQIDEMKQITSRQLRESLKNSPKVISLITHINQIVMKVKINNPILSVKEEEIVSYEPHLNILIDIAKALFDILEKLLIFQCRNAQVAYEYLFSEQYVNQWKKNQSSSIYDSFGQIIDVILIFLRSFFEKIYGSLKMTSLEKQGQLKKLYELFSDGIAKLVKIIQEKIHLNTVTNAIEIRMIIEPIRNLLHGPEYKHTISFIHMLHKKTKDSLSNILKQLTLKNKQSIDHLPLVALFSEKFLFQIFKHKEENKITSEELGNILDSTNLTELVTIFYGIRCTLSNWTLNNESVKIQNKKLFSSLKTQQFQLITNLITPGTFLNYGLAINRFLEIQQKLLIEPLPQHHRNYQRRLRTRAEIEDAFRERLEERPDTRRLGRIDLREENIFMRLNRRNEERRNLFEVAEDGDQKFKQLAMQLVEKIIHFTPSEELGSLINQVFIKISDDQYSKNVLKNIVNEIETHLLNISENAPQSNSNSNSNCLNGEEQKINTLIKNLCNIVTLSNNKRHLLNHLYSTSIFKSLLLILTEFRKPKHVPLLVNSFTTLSKIIPYNCKLQRFNAATFYYLFLTADSVLKIIKQSNDRKLAQEVFSLITKTIGVVLENYPQTLNLYVQMFPFSYLSKNSTQFFITMLINTNPSLTKISMEAEIKSYFCSKESILKYLGTEENHENYIAIQFKEFQFYFAKYHKDKSFIEVCNAILSRQTVVLNGKKNTKVILYKGNKNHYSKSQILNGASFLSYHISQKEKMIMKMLQKLVLQIKAPSEETSKNIAQFVYRIGILTPYFILSKVEDRNQSFLDLLVEKTYTSIELKNILFLIGFEKGLVIEQNGTPVQTSNYFQWKIILKIFRDLKKAKNENIRPILLFLLYFLQFKEMHILLNVPYSQEDPQTLKQFLEKNVDFSDIVVNQLMYVIYKQQHMHALRDLYADTREKKILNSETRFENHLIGLPFIYPQQPSPFEDRRRKQVYTGQFLPRTESNRLPKVSKLKQKKFLNTYYSQIEFNIQVPIQQEYNLKELSYKDISFKGAEYTKPSQNISTPSLTFVNIKNKKFNTRFEELSKIIHKQPESDLNEPDVDLEAQNYFERQARAGRTRLVVREIRNQEFPDVIREEIQLRNFMENSDEEDVQSFRPIARRRLSEDSILERLVEDVNEDNIFAHEDRMRRRNYYHRHQSLSVLENSLREFNLQNEVQRWSNEESPLRNEEQPQFDLNPSVRNVVNLNRHESVISFNCNPFVQQIPQVVAEEAVIQQEVPVDPIVFREVLQVLGLRQSFLRDNGIDEELFDQLPRDVQIEQLMSAQNNPNQPHNQMIQQNPEQNNALEFLSNIPEELRMEVIQQQLIPLSEVPVPMNQESELLAILMATQDQQIRRQILLQITPEILSTLPQQIQDEAERYRSSRHRRLTLEQYMQSDSNSDVRLDYSDDDIENERYVRKKKVPIEYPKISKDIFPDLSLETVKKIMATLFDFDTQNNLIEILLENKKTQESMINTLLYSLRNDSDDKNLEHLKECLNLKTQAIKSGILNLLFNAKKKMLYHDSDFLQEKYSYKTLGNIALSPCKQLLCPDTVSTEYHIPYYELLLQSLRVNSLLSASLLSKLPSGNIPNIILNEIIELLANSEVSDQFIASLKPLSTNLTMKTLFSQKFNTKDSLKLNVYGKLICFEFAETPFIKQLHLEALRKYKLEYSDFVNQGYKFYSTEELKNTTELQNYKHIQYKVIKYLINKGKNLKEEPISRILEFPELVSFSIKKEIFESSLKKLNFSSRFRKIRLKINRDDSFQSGFQQIMSRTKEEIKTGSFHVKFEGEEGSDAGALTREFFIEISKQMVSAKYNLFESSKAGNTYHPDKNSSVNPNHLQYFKYIGRLVGKSLSSRILMDLHFTHTFLKLILGKELTLEDMQNFDYTYYQNLKFCENNSVEDLNLTFSEVDDRFGQIKIKQLIPGGQNVQVTEQNKFEYINKRAMYRMNTIIQQQTKAFKAGMFEIIPFELIQYFTPPQLEILLCGFPKIDVNKLKHNAKYSSYTQSSEVIRWFWQVLFSFTQEELASLLQFITGSSKDDGNVVIQIYNEILQNKQNLPTASACFNKLILPEYESRQILQRKLKTAISCESVGFYQV